ncbi:MAG: hypothetical protein WCO56_19305 [Verrucomicrobiota bacterium]
MPDEATVPSNASVCTRCRWHGWPVEDEGRRNYSGWSIGKRGVRYGFGTSRRAKVKLVCASCGSGSLVEAGSPRGIELLAKEGYKVGRMQLRIGCSGLLVPGIIMVVLAHTAINSCNPTSSTSQVTKPASTLNVPQVKTVQPETPAPKNNTPSNLDPAPVVKDPGLEARTVQWLIHEADNGISHAQYSLGIRYLKGDGVPQDDLIGLKYLGLAAEQKNAQAKDALEKYSKGIKP